MLSVQGGGADELVGYGVGEDDLSIGRHVANKLASQEIGEDELAV